MKIEESTWYKGICEESLYEPTFHGHGNVFSTIEEAKKTLDKHIKEWGEKKYYICMHTYRKVSDDNGKLIKIESVDEVVEEYPMAKTIKYTSPNGYTGILYDWHESDLFDEFHYQMSIRDEGGIEVLHAYNATSKTLEELKKIVDEHKSLRQYLINFSKEYDDINV